MVFHYKISDHDIFASSTGYAVQRELPPILHFHSAQKMLENSCNPKHFLVYWGSTKLSLPKIRKSQQDYFSSINRSWNLTDNNLLL